MGLGGSIASHDSPGSNVPGRERIRLRDGLRVEDLGDEIVILDADGDAVHRVEGDALAAVRLLQEGVARRDIPAELTDAVTSLADAGLVDGPNHLSRRAALVSGGGIALTAATVTTFALADPAAASTMCTGGFTPTPPDSGSTGNKYTVQGTYTYNTGPGVTSLLVRAWGAGGGGGGGGGGYDRGGGGGGGGAYASTSNVPVSECTGYTVVVGAAGGGDNGDTLSSGSSGGNGGSSSFGGTLVVAAGGTGGGGHKTGVLDRTPGAGGSGGTTAASTGTTEYKGGNGGAGRDDISGGGGGGGSAGHGGAGGDGQTRHAVIAMALLSGGGLATPSVQGEPSAEVRERCRRVNKVVFAEGGLNVLFVNCDSRRARIHRFLIDDTPLAPEVDDVLVPRETRIPGVHLVTGIGEGSAETNPIEVVALQQQIIDEYRSSYHVILLDTAPFLATNDASELLSRTDLVTVVVRSGRTTAESAHRVAEVLERFAAPVLGVVFNGSDETRGAQYYYYGYTEPSQPPLVQPQAQPAAAATAAAAQN